MNNKEKIIMKVSIVSILLNIILALIKLLIGFISSSIAMISDGIHSSSDVLSTIIVIIGAKISNREADETHPYGHERFECIATFILGMILIFVGFEIGLNVIKDLVLNVESIIDLESGKLALIVAIISIISKEAMFWYSYSAGKKIDSSSLKADAWHHRSDAISSVGSFIGILGALLGFPKIEKIASIIICLIILKTGYDIVKDAIKELIDEACDEETENQIKEIVLNEDGVINIDSLKTRVFATRIYIDLEIGADKDKTLEESHIIAQNVHDKIESKITKVKHCMVHVNPK